MITPTNILSYKGMAYLTAGCILSEFIWHMYKKHRNSSFLKKLNEEVFCDTIFFNELGEGCRSHSNSNRACNLSTCPVENINRLKNYLRSATRSVDVCVYFLTCLPLVREIINLHKEGVMVRIITDNESFENQAGQVNNLWIEGVPLKSCKFQYLMHHKFFIVDKKLLITGSANWTVQAFFGNCENIFITNHKELVSKFIQEFDSMWEKFDEPHEEDGALVMT